VLRNDHRRRRRPTGRKGPTNSSYAAGLHEGWSEGAGGGQENQSFPHQTNYRLPAISVAWNFKYRCDEVCFPYKEHAMSFLTASNGNSKVWLRGWYDLEPFFKADLFA
jgi:hypothetical protein